MGTVVSAKDGSILFDARVQAESNGTYYRGRTDAYGKFRISAIPPGKYAFMIIYEEDTLKNIIANVPSDGIDNLGKIEFRGKTITELEDFVLKVEKDPQIKLTYGVTPEIKMTAEEIARSPIKFDQTALIASMSSEIKVSTVLGLVVRTPIEMDSEIESSRSVAINKRCSRPSPSRARRKEQRTARWRGRSR